MSRRNADKNKKRGPRAVIEGKGVRIPIYAGAIRGVMSYQLAFYRNGVRQRKRAATLEAARKRAKELIEELSTGVAHVASLSAKQAAAVNEVVEILKPVGIPFTEAVRQFAEAHTQLAGQGTIADAVRLFVEEGKKAKLVPIKLPELVARFLADIRAREKSRRYIVDMQARLHKAAITFKCSVDEIQAHEIDEWLASMKKASGRTKNNYRTALITLFSFGRQKGHLSRDRQTEAEFSARYSDKGGEIGIYTPAELEILLASIEPRLVPFVAIGGFAGLRSAEIVRLEWPEIRFDQEVIEIKAAKAKTASRRLVPILPALKAWLNPLRKAKGRVLAGVLDEFALAKQFRNAVAAIRGEDGKPLIKIVPNGLRHSFITYRMATLKNAAEVALEAGNSPRMIFEHYRELTTAEQATAWFSTRPNPMRVNTLTRSVIDTIQDEEERTNAEILTQNFRAAGNSRSSKRVQKFLLPEQTMAA
jgi:integrase